VDVGKLGHINADSDLGEWPVGRDILKQFEKPLEEEPETPKPAAAPELF
jgi:predicted alpha/beta hydrolase family esterase